MDSALSHVQETPPSTASSSKIERTARLVDLDEDQKAKILAMSKASDMDRPERKRQYSALRRAILKEASPQLVAKFTFCSDRERCFGSMVHVLCFA